MKKRAYHSILQPNGEVTQGPVVVTTDREGKLIEWHLLDGEEPMTEWIGGTYEQKVSEAEKDKK